MRCEDCRHAISARLDGELDARDADPLDAHLVGCARCRRFADRAAQVTRVARTRVAEPIPDLVTGVLEAATPTRREHSGTAVLRLLLGGNGLAQIGLAVADLLATTSAGHGGPAVVGAGPIHLAHESAAWNLALGVGFLWVACGGRTRGMVAVVGAFVACLTAVSALDVLSGIVGPGRLATHLVAVWGLVLLIALDMATNRGADGGGGHTDRRQSGSEDHTADRVARPGSGGDARPDHPAA